MVRYLVFRRLQHLHRLPYRSPSHQALEWEHPWIKTPRVHDQLSALGGQTAHISQNFKMKNNR